MVLLVAAHATTVGFMVALSHLKFGPPVAAKRHRRLLLLIASYVVLGYPFAYTVWLTFLVVKSLQGHVVARDGFLVIISERFNSAGPSRWAMLIGGLVAAGLAGVGVWIAQLLATLGGWASGSFLVFGLGPTLLSASLRHRQDDVGKRFEGVVRVEGLVPTERLARGKSVEAAQDWLRAASRPVGWVADEGLRTHYERILSPWGVTGFQVNPGHKGFWGLLMPPRYAFVKR